MKEELSSLPPPPTDNQTFLVHSLIRDFDESLGCRLRGDLGHNDFQGGLRRIAEGFQRALKSIRPTIKLIETLEEENKIASQLELPRTIAVVGNRQENEWFGDRDREESPSLRKGRKSQRVEVLSSDEGPSSQPKRRRGTNESTAMSASKKSKKTPGSMSGDDGVYSSQPFFIFLRYAGWIGHIF